MTDNNPSTLDTMNAVISDVEQKLARWGDSPEVARRARVALAALNAARAAWRDEHLKHARGFIRSAAALATA